MFENLDFGKSLNEDLFDSWLETGRNHPIGYKYLLVIWSPWDDDFLPVYTTSREEISAHGSKVSPEQLVAAYDLYSESKINFDH